MQFNGKVYKFSFVVLLLQTLVILSPVSAREGNGADNSYFRLIASTCLTCHSAGNGEAAAIPRLDGLTPAELRQLLSAYKSGREQATIMNRIAKALTYGEIDGVSELFSKTGQ